MAENEIVKHAEAAYKAVKDPQTSWLHKLKEVLIEIFIIVFAVSLSIWFHNWSDSLHERQEERDFLKGMKEDIQADLNVVRGDSLFYERQLRHLHYFQRVASGEPLNHDSLKAYMSVFFSYATPEPHVGRYEGLKGSGKFSIIENAELLNNIITLHEQTLVHIETLDKYYADYINRIGNFIQEHSQFNLNDSTITNARDILRMPEMQFQLFNGESVISTSILRDHDSCIVRCQRLIDQIDKEKE
jgi:hypothetical protein